MFDLDTALQEWSADLTKSQRQAGHHAEEMLDHLRMTIDDLVNRGHTPQEAFTEAIAQFGSATEIGKQYPNRGNQLAVAHIVGALFWAALIIALSNDGNDLQSFLVWGWMTTVLLPLTVAQARMDKRSRSGKRERFSKLK